MSVTLVIMSRRHRAGLTKTRLVPSLGAEGAASFARASLADVAERFADLGEERVIAWDGPRSPDDVPVELPPDAFGSVLQGDGDLGERMGALHRRFGDVVFVGADAPTLPRRSVARALELIAGGYRAVVQPAIDGGYTLLGVASGSERLLRGIPWGTDRVLASTLEAAEGIAGRVGILEPWYDVDDVGGLRVLRAHLPLLEGTEDHPRRTARVIERHPGENHE